MSNNNDLLKTDAPGPSIDKPEKGTRPTSEQDKSHQPNTFQERHLGPNKFMDNGNCDVIDKQLQTDH